jgi:WhiB family transcriptional regulator, redox-sensing transcriptional regulator
MIAHAAILPELRAAGVSALRTAAPATLPDLSLPQPGRLAWQEAALCAQADPDAWFPEKGGSVRDVKAVCRECPVRAECLLLALERGEDHGVWGGLTERERRALKDGPVRPLADVFAEADERASRSLERSSLKNVRRLAAERRRRQEAGAPAKGIAA